MFNFNHFDQPTAIVSVDVETDWGGRLTPCRENLKGVDQGLPLILATLAKYQIKGTFFVSGQIVPLIKSQLSEIVTLGHEIASHSFTHRHLPTLSPEEIKQELGDSKAILEDTTQQSIQGFRAPQGRIPQGLAKELAQQGYLYDASVFGGKMPQRFDNRHIPLFPYLWEEIWEIPVNQLPVIPLPMGLLWIDLFTLNTIKLASKIQPLPPFVHLYLHPFDVIPSYRVSDVPLGAKLWYTRRPGSAIKTLERVLGFLEYLGYRFITAQEAITKISIMT
jgi:peptidoglycan/xylan/chitin deacetylase (PgdA/CDA1 family)